MGESFPGFCRRFCFISRKGLHLFLNRTVVAYVFIDSRLFILTLLDYPSPATAAATSRTIAVAIAFAFASAFLEEADVYGVCGYAHGRNGHWYAFSIINRDSPVEESRLYQDMLCKVLVK